MHQDPTTHLRITTDSQQQGLKRAARRHLLDPTRGAPRATDGQGRVTRFRRLRSLTGLGSPAAAPAPSAILGE